MSDTEAIENEQEKIIVSKEEVAETAQEIMANLLKLMKADVQLTMGERDGVPLISLSGADESILIGHYGDTLQTLQLLLSLMLQKKFHGCASEVIVDVDNYLERRRDTITQIAVKMANKAIDTHHSVNLKPMPAHERRIVHMALKEYPGVSTFSTGEGDERFITIVPEDK